MRICNLLSGFYNKAVLQAMGGSDVIRIALLVFQEAFEKDFQSQQPGRCVAYCHPEDD